jgi:hypothetical protein
VRDNSFTAHETKTEQGRAYLIHRNTECKSWALAYRDVRALFCLLFLCKQRWWLGGDFQRERSEVRGPLKKEEQENKRDLKAFGFSREVFYAPCQNKQYEFIWPFDSAKMLQISKFSAFFDPNSLLDFSVSIWPRPSTEVSMFISRTHRFWCYNANLCSINTNGAITIWLSFKFEFY